MRAQTSVDVLLVNARDAKLGHDSMIGEAPAETKETIFRGLQSQNVSRSIRICKPSALAAQKVSLAQQNQ